MILVMTEPNHSRDSIESLLPSEPFIGVFDSGVGGLSVLAQLTRKLPGESSFIWATQSTLHMVTVYPVICSS